MNLRTILVTFALSLGGCVFVCSDGTFPGYSEGVRSGKVIKVSRKGLIWKSWEATMLMEGMQAEHTNDGTSFAPNLWYFSTQDELMADSIESAMESGEPISVRYSEYLTGPFWMETSYVAKGIEK